MKHKHIAISDGTKKPVHNNKCSSHIKLETISVHIKPVHISKTYNHFITSNRNLDNHFITSTYALHKHITYNNQNSWYQKIQKLSNYNYYRASTFSFSRIQWDTKATQLSNQIKPTTKCHTLLTLPWKHSFLGKLAPLIDLELGDSLNHLDQADALSYHDNVLIALASVVCSLHVVWRIVLCSNHKVIPHQENHTPHISTHH